MLFRGVGDSSLLENQEDHPVSTTCVDDERLSSELLDTPRQRPLNSSQAHQMQVERSTTPRCTHSFDHFVPFFSKYDPSALSLYNRSSGWF
jgi:hypothetical protein